MTITMTKPTNMRGASILLPFVAALAAGCAGKQPPAPATAQAAPAAPGVRTPDAILADAVAATGGVAGWAAHKTAHIKLTISLQGMGMGGPAEHFQTNANQSLTLTTLPGVGTIREGSNGKVLWAQDPINGLRLLDGAEAEQARIEAAWNTDLQAHELFPKIETAIDSPAGLECLMLTPKVGPPIRNCYDAQTHLQVSQEGMRATAQGDMPFHSPSKTGAGGRGEDPVRLRDPGGADHGGHHRQRVVVRRADGRQDVRAAGAGRAVRGGGAVSRKVILCRCEDVTLADVQHAVKLGYAAISRRSSATPASAPAPARARSACARSRAPSPRPPGAIPPRSAPFTARPPLVPVELGVLAAAGRELARENERPRVVEHTRPTSSSSAPA